MPNDRSRIGETAQMLLLQLRIAYANNHERDDVSLSRGTLFLKSENDKKSLTELLTFMHRHISPDDIGHTVQKVGESNG